jgi:hypothetical protein
MSVLAVALLAFAAATACLAQTPYVGRFDLYTGFSDLNTPGLNNINQIGFHLQAGVTANRWTSYGFDYSVQNGSTNFTPGIATTALRQQLAAELPPGYSLQLPVAVTIQTFTGGGQLIFRHYKQATFFVRPVLAAFHIRGTPHPNDPINTLVAAQLAPQGYLTDWYGAYGAGGGVEFPVMKHLGARVQFDAGWNHPFTNLLEHGSFTYRYSIGPAFHFGPHVKRAERS